MKTTPRFDQVREVPAVSLLGNDEGSARKAKSLSAEAARELLDLGTAALADVEDFDAAGTASEAVATEAATRSAADTTLAGSITSEAAAREAADATLTSAVAAKVSTTAVGSASGVCPLDASTKVAAIYLPSFVDDVVEASDFAALPGTGETGKIYVTLDTNKTYRWSGSAYVEISPSPGSTDVVPEGSTNLYFTAARARAVVLTGLLTVTNQAVAATDNILQALGYIVARLNALWGRSIATGTGLTGGGDLSADRTLSVSFGSSSGTVCQGNDARLSDSRAPTIHATSHASGGSDPITIAESQVTNLTTDLAAKAPLASPAFTGNPTAATQTAGNNSTRLATTAYVDSAIGPLALQSAVDTVADYLADEVTDRGSADTALQANIDLKAPLASPAFTGNPTATTQTAGNNTTRIATTAFVQTAVANLIASAPGALDTLDELAAALGDDANFAASTVTALALKAPLASPTFTGTPAGPTAAVDTNTTQFATTAFVISQAATTGDGTPAMNGTAARGTSTHFARADHVHPVDTSRAAASHTHAWADITSGTPTTLAGYGITDGQPHDSDLDSVAAGNYVASVTGTTNRITVSAATGTVTFNLPQDIHTGATPTFGGMTSTGNITMTANSGGAVMTMTPATVYTTAQFHTWTFTPKYNAAGTTTSVCSIRFRRNSTADGIYHGDMLFQTRNSGSALADAMFLDQEQNALFYNKVTSINGTGYRAGAGGAVTQATSKSTAVTLNKACGAITMHNATLNAGVVVSFTLTNSMIEADDIVVVHHKSAGTAASYECWPDTMAAGSCKINVRNITAGNLGEAIVLSFAVIKGAIS